MFPDSKIAASFSQEETKVKYNTGPYIKESLIKDLCSCPFTSNLRRQPLSKWKNNMMGMFSISQNIKTVYCGSLFIGLCDSSDLVQHFIDFSKKMKWDNSYLLQLGMNLSEMLHNEMNKSFINVGTCPLHIEHNSFQKDITTFDFNFDEFSYNIHVFFSNWRREDFKDTEFITNISVMAKHERGRRKNNQSTVSSIDIEVITTVLFFFIKIFC